mmetsp:Transcript_835/g.1374  ORF Transcript_835/g.1374 Transcript_835/m.1374 type:complete len:680 (-) Transcript_835:373-2412(-)
MCRLHPDEDEHPDHMNSQTTRVIDELEAEICHLHDFIESKGYNSRGISDVLGRPFAHPVDAEHRAKQLLVFSFAQPHMRAFHLAWFGFFATFFSTFAAAPLLPYIKVSLQLTKSQMAAAAMASVGSTIFFRLVMGLIADTCGARKGLSILLLITIPPLLAMMYVTDAIGFIVCRSLIGIGLASFVACQAWVSVMFSKKIVGLANATAGGWGNLGGGFTNFVMPLLFAAMSSFGMQDDRAWRVCFIFPAVMHLVIGIAAFSGRDLPDGNFDELESSGAKQKSDGSVVLRVGMTNVNAWILALLYGMSFGVELTVTNEAALYFHEYHGLSVSVAGLLASAFGMMNLFARSLGGFASDASAARFGMRGRITVLFFAHLCEGFFCILLGLITTSQPLNHIAATNSAGCAVAILSIFSLFVQIAEGATYSIVPQVSRPALGIVSGLVGAGGNLGSVVTEALFFSSEAVRTDTAFVHMGIAILLTSLFCLFIYFPEEGGILWSKGLFGSYDPQLIKPPLGYRGADAMDYDNVQIGSLQPNTTVKSNSLVTVRQSGSAPKHNSISSSASNQLPCVEGLMPPLQTALTTANEPPAALPASLTAELSTAEIKERLCGALPPAALAKMIKDINLEESCLEDKLDQLRLREPGCPTHELRKLLAQAAGDLTSVLPVQRKPANLSSVVNLL